MAWTGASAETTDGVRLNPPEERCGDNDERMTYAIAEEVIRKFQEQVLYMQLQAEPGNLCSWEDEDRGHLLQLEALADDLANGDFPELPRLKALL